MAHTQVLHESPVRISEPQPVSLWCALALAEQEAPLSSGAQLRSVPNREDWSRVISELTEYWPLCREAHVATTVLFRTQGRD